MNPPISAPSTPDRRAQPSANPSIVLEEGEQIGGGRRAPSPLPVQTPTRLRTIVKATTWDSGLIRQAETRRSRLVDKSSSAVHGNSADDPFVERPESVGQSNNALSVACASDLFGDISDSVYSPFLPNAGDERNHDIPGNGANEGNNPVSTGTNQPLTSPTAPGHRGNDLSVGRHEHSGETSCPPEQAQLTRKHPRVHRGQDVSAVEAASAPSAPEEDISVLPENIPDRDDTPRANTIKIPHPTPGPSDARPLDLNLVSAHENQAALTPSSTSSPRVLEGCLSDGDLPIFEDLSDTKSLDGDSIFTMGRSSASVLTMLEEGFEEIHTQFTELAGRVGMPLQQVITRFGKQFSTRTNSFNGWNRYQSFYVAHKAQELARLTETGLVTATPSQRMTLCYKQFRIDYPDTWQEILTKFEEAEILENAEKTVAQRQSLFRKLAKDHAQRFSSMAKAHSFEGVFLMAGGVVNQDGGLGHVFASPGASDFFLDRCRVDDHEILGHFKAHVYNKTSLSNLPPLDSGNAVQQLEGQPLKKKEGRALKRERNPPKKEKEKEAEVVEEVEAIDAGEREDHARVRGALVQALKAFGCRWATGKLFPWKALPVKLAKSAIVCYNFPDTILFPGEERNSRPKSSSKGISVLTLAECATLLAALNDTSDNRLYFKKEPQQLAALEAASVPVIHGAAPEFGSPHARGRRIFADLKHDRLGLPRKDADRSLTRVRKRRAPSPQTDTISIPDSDDVPVRPSKRRALSIHDSDGIEELPGPPEPSQNPAHRRSKVDVIITRSGTMKSVVKDMQARPLDSEEDGPRDLSSPSGSDYHPDEDEKVALSDGDGEGMQTDKLDKTGPSSRKRKATATLVKKGKAKERATRTRRSRRASGPSSEDESTTTALDPGPVKVAGKVDQVKLAAQVVDPKIFQATSSHPLTTVVPGPERTENTGEKLVPPVPQSRPKPRVVMKDSTRTDVNQDVDDAFSLRKRRAPSQSAEPVAPAAPTNLRGTEDGQALAGDAEQGDCTLADKPSDKPSGSNEDQLRDAQAVPHPAHNGAHWYPPGPDTRLFGFPGMGMYGPPVMNPYMYWGRYPEANAMRPPSPLLQHRDGPVRGAFNGGTQPYDAPPYYYYGPPNPQLPSGVPTPLQNGGPQAVGGHHEGNENVADGATRLEDGA